MSSSIIAHIAAEISPFAKMGGLGDMVASLGVALKKLKLKPIFILPKYGFIPETSLKPTTLALPLDIGPTSYTARVWKGNHPSGIDTYLIDIPELYERPGIYGEIGRDYPDNALRFSAFSLAAIALLQALKKDISLIHVHDWHTALIPFYLKTRFAPTPPFPNARTVLTIHNLGYQGIFPYDQWPALALDRSFFTSEHLEFYGQINFLKAGLVSADFITTVSLSYAAETLTEESGCGLEGILRTRLFHYRGILNGIDTEEWDPQTDPHLLHHFSADHVQGKRDCKMMLQKEMGLPMRADIPLIIFIGRLVDQKGIDIILESIAALGEQAIQWIFLGSGNPAYEKALHDLAQTYSGKVSARIGFDVGLSHRIAGGGDFSVMPSRYEPCGLNQLYSMRYGAIPIVHSVGGLRDTVSDATVFPESGTGFVFKGASKGALCSAIGRALHLYKSPARWHTLQRSAMSQDFSWHRSAREYVTIYRKSLELPPHLLPLPPS